MSLLHFIFPCWKRSFKRLTLFLLPPSHNPRRASTAGCKQYIVFIVFFFIFAFSFTCSQASSLPLHDRAVEMMRAGQYGEAIPLLETLHHEQPDNIKIFNDLVVAYSWDKKYEDACALFEQHGVRSYPTYVQKAAFTAYRSSQQPDQALEIVNILLEKEPDSTTLLLYKGLLLVDKHQLGPAREILAVFLAGTGKDSSYYRLSGYIHAAEENWIAAIADYQELCRLLPDDQAAVRELFFALQHARSQQAAAAVLAEHPQFFTDQDRALLLLNQAGEKLRWSTDAAKDYDETKLLAMQALAMQIRALDMLGTGTTKKIWPELILYDLTVTMRNLRRMHDVESMYTYLTEKGEVPNYVKQAAAGARLADRKPDKARELYQQILETEPDSYQAQIGLFYCYIEEEDFDSAYELIDDLRQNEPGFQATKDKQIPSYNHRYLDLTVYSILARYFGDQLDEAWSGIDELVRNAPANSWLLELRGQISNSRQWHRQAQYDFHYASLLSPESLGAKAGEASSLILLREFREARSLLEFMQEEYPDEHATRRLEKEWTFSRKPQYWGDITYGSSSGPEIDGDAMVASVELLSSPINDNLYVDGLYRYAWAEIIEGEESFKRYSLGLDYHLTDWNFLGRVTYNDSTLDEVGGSLTARWSPDDFWLLSLSGERFSVDTPLRALYHRIRSDALSATIGYRWSEQRDLYLGIQAAEFTDDNDRLAASAVFRQRLLDIPRIDVDGRIELYGSSNSRRLTPYFNPEKDFSLKGALHLDHVYFRHYDDLLAHQLDVGYGFYDQKGYGSRWIGHIRYEQRYKFTPRVEMLAGIEFGRNVYDGHAEPYRLVRFMINGKF